MGSNPGYLLKFFLLYVEKDIIMICMYCFFAAFLDFINMESENKKVWSRLETHEEWKSRIEKELLERKEQEKAKLEIENELRKRTERKTAKLKKKKELQEAKV